MSELRFENFSVKGRRIGKASWFPAIRELIKSEISAELDEDDNLFIGYGMMPDSLPYTLQDAYDTPEEELTYLSGRTCSIKTKLWRMYCFNFATISTSFGIYSIL